MSEDHEDAFGFGSIHSTRDLIKQIRPSVPVDQPDLSKIDAVADSAGFVSRESFSEPEPAYRTQRYLKPEPRIPLNMRVPVSLGAAFQKFCEQERYSYPQALAEIMRRAGVSQSSSS